ncbi:hypothetical protein VE04_09261 [Pseudogymnoascus sp. 24MN13]|nr:hypothetical protein VE04_09261 [Pseudogymnoascus sp. 24MN13]
MKYLANLCLAILVVGDISAAIADAEHEPICWRPGQPCGKVKRAAEAVAEAVGEPIAEPICWRPGQPCGKVKRQPCGKAKRAALALAHAVANANPEAEAFFDKLAIREAFLEPEALNPLTRNSSARLRLSAGALGSHVARSSAPLRPLRRALAEAAPEPICWRPGQPCGKAKRDAEAAAEAICWRPGQPCGKAKREANALAQVAAEALASLEKKGEFQGINRPYRPPTTTAAPTTTTPTPTAPPVVTSTTVTTPPAVTPGPCHSGCKYCTGLVRNATSASSSTSAEIRRSFASVQSDIFKPTKYGSKYTVTLIPGDGIGAEITESVKTVFKADNVPIEWEQVDVSGLESGRKHSEELFRESIASLKRNKIGLKGILHTPVAALRPPNIPGYETRHKNVDFAIIRENTEGEYSGLEHQSVPGVVESLKIITRAKSERIAKFAFSFALANNRKKVTCIHKANIMKLADGLFRNTFNAVAKEFPTLESSDMIVDNASMQCVSRPQQFDVMVMPNLYGGILSNVGAALVGGPGIVPGCNMGRDVAVFEPGCRHVGLDIKGKDQANPTAMLLSGAMMLRHLGLDEHANRISKAVYDVIAAGTTTDFSRAVLDKM